MNRERHAPTRSAREWTEATAVMTGQIEQRAALARQGNLLWAPCLSDDFANERLAGLRLVTPRVACWNVRTAATLIKREFGQIVVTLPIVRDDDLRVLRRLAASASVTVVIDHFRHAELLAMAVRGSAATLGVLIAVDVGTQGMGVKPGTDTARLALAVSQMPPLRLDGVFVDDAPSHSSTASGRPDTASTFSDALHQGRHAMQSIGRTGQSSPILAVSSADWPTQRAMLNDGTLVIDQGLLAERQPGPSADATAGGCDTIRGVVVSRPTFERCLIDVGTMRLGDEATIVITRPAGGVVLELRAETAIVSLSGESLDLAIGDEVVIERG